MGFTMLPTPSTFNPNVPFTSQMPQNPMAGYPNAGQSNMPPQGSPMQTPEGVPNQTLGNPQTQSYAHGGRTKKRPSMIEVYMSPDEIAKMVDAQGGADHDRYTGRHMFKKLSRFMENPHIDKAIRQKFAFGGGIPNPFSAVTQNFATGGEVQSPFNGVTSVINRAHELGMARPGFAEGGSTRQYNMPARAPLTDEQYARGGDTELVYITPHMKRLFDDLGKGTINPVTGHPEYFGLSDLWSGLKSVGSTALGGLNAVAPQLAEFAKPYAAKLPGMWGTVANAALDYAPGAISALNSYVNPSKPAPSTQTPQDQQQNQSNFSSLPFGGEEGMQELPQQQQQPQSFGQHMGNYAAKTAGQIGGPMGRTAQAGIQSYMDGRDMKRTGANMFGAGTSQMPHNPAFDIAQRGVKNFGRNMSMGQNLRNMGGEAVNQFMRPGSNNDRRAMESQYLDQIYKQPQSAYS